MKLQTFIRYILWCSSVTKVWLFDISSANPSGSNSIQSSYYLGADTNTKNIDPNEELKRTQRSFLKKIWKDSGLQDLFNDACVNCCNNDNYNAGEGDTYESPPTSSYIPYFQQILPLYPLQPFDPLKIFQPFIKPMDHNTNELNGGSHINIYDNDNIPKRYEGGNSNVIINDENPFLYNKISGTCDNTECKNIGKNEIIENNGSNSDKCNNVGPIYKEENAIMYKKNNKDTDRNTDTEALEEVYVYPELKSKATQTQQAYPSLNGSSGRIVYQPIIYVSPQYHVVPPLYNYAYNSNQKIEESKQRYSNVETQHEYNTEQKEHPPFYNNYKGEPDIKVSCTVLSNKEYTPLTSSGLLSPEHFIYGVVSQCSDTKVTPSDIAIQAPQVSNTFALSSQTQPFNGNLYSYLNTINDYNKEPAPPIVITKADQPYRNCPELFTNYLNQGNYKKDHAKGNAYAHFISC